VTDRLYADYDTLSHAEGQLSAASGLLSESTLLIGAVQLGSGAVEAVLAQTTSIHQARISAVADLLAVEKAGVRGAILEFTNVDEQAGATGRRLGAAIGGER
jgi:hypothetical protein